MDRRTFEVLLELLVASDPWPLEPEKGERLKEWADEEAWSYGYDNWIEAYHKKGRGKRNE